MNMPDPRLTNEVGAPVADNENTLTIGPRGPAALQDVWLLEKMAHFNREVIPERRMHAKGSGAYGTFTVTHDVRCWTKAKVFGPGEKTDVFVRFSTVAGERGAADAERDIRGFACKFYTRDGNWDLVGNNTPVFFLRDAQNFPGLNRAVKRDPKTNLRDAQNNWDFWTILPEAMHQITIVMSDKGIPASYRHMDGFGSHTFSLYDKDNHRVWCKFHMLTQQGIKNLTDEEAQALIGKDRESHGRDLYNAIAQGDFPRWTMYFQIMTEEEALHHYENPFDITKKWSTKEFPLHEVGELELNRNPENYFAEVEQAAFSPAHVVPGIGFSPDKLLQGRLFAYGDAQRYRLGVNHNLIPVNSAQVRVHDQHRDGMMRTDGNYGATVAYTPNSCGEWQAQPDTAEPPVCIKGAMWRFDPKEDPTDNNFRQAGELFRSMSAGEKSRLIANTMRSIGSVDCRIQYRHAAHCILADEEYGRMFVAAAGLKWSKALAYSKLSNDELIEATHLDCCSHG